MNKSCRHKLALIICLVLPAALPPIAFDWFSGPPLLLVARHLLLGLLLLAGYFLIVKQPTHDDRIAGLINRAARLCLLVWLIPLVIVSFSASPLEGKILFLQAETSLWLLVAMLVAHFILRSANRSLFFLGIALPLLIVEAALQTFAALDHPQLRIVGPKQQSQRNWHQPGQTYTYYGPLGHPMGDYLIEGRWNSLGFNDREPPDQTNRDPVIAVVGDSYVEAVQVPMDQNFYRVAELELQKRGIIVRTVGLGYSGSGAGEAAERLSHYGPLLKPAVVVYAFCYNDVRDDFPPWNKALKKSRRTPGWLKAKGHPLLLVQNLRYRARKLADGSFARKTEYPVPSQDLTLAPDEAFDTRKAYATFFTNVKRLHDLSRELDARLVLLELYPSNDGYMEDICKRLTQAGIDCDPEGPAKRISRHAADYDYLFVRTRDQILEAKKELKVVVYRYDFHYNAAGHLLVGRTMAAALADHVLPGLSPAKELSASSKEITQP